jgi:hypothetical protein
MVTLMQARSKMSKEQHGKSGISIPKISAGDGERSLQNLVESVKRKSAVVQQPGIGKRRKL